MTYKGLIGVLLFLGFAVLAAAVLSGLPGCDDVKAIKDEARQVRAIQGELDRLPADVPAAQAEPIRRALTDLASAGDAGDLDDAQQALGLARAQLVAVLGEDGGGVDGVDPRVLKLAGRLDRVLSRLGGAVHAGRGPPVVGAVGEAAGTIGAVLPPPWGTVLGFGGWAAAAVVTVRKEMILRAFTGLVRGIQSEKKAGVVDFQGDAGKRISASAGFLANKIVAIAKGTRSRWWPF